MRTIGRIALAAAAALAVAPASSLAYTPTVTETLLPPSDRPLDITSGPDGALWFTLPGASGLGRVVPGGSPTFPVTLAATEHPLGITTGPDGNLWYAEDDGGFHSQIGRYSPATAAHTTFGAATLSNHRPAGITVGPDGNLWFSETNNGAVGRVTPAGAVTEFAAGSGFGIAAGPDGNLWTTLSFADALARTTTGGLTGPPFPVGSQPRSIVAGPDGNLWFTEYAATKIGVVNPAGTLLHEYPVSHQPVDIAVGPDGALWFTEGDAAFTGASIGRLTTDGALRETPLRFDNSDPAGITAGPDGNVWFVENFAQQVGVITTPPNATTGGASGVGATTATVSGIANVHSQAGGYRFDWGPTTSYGSSTSEAALPATATDQPVTAALSGLPPGSVVHYRLAVRNGTDTTFGADQTFTTGAPAAGGGGGSGSPGSGAGGAPAVLPVSPPPTGDRAARIAFRVTRVTMSRAGKGTAAFTCAGGASCAVSAALTASTPRKRAARSAVATVGRLSGSAPAGRDGKLRLALNRAGKRALRRRKTLTVSARGTVNRATPFTQRLELVLAAGKPRR
jgi:streptogramin lyase